MSIIARTKRTSRAVMFVTVLLGLIWVMLSKYFVPNIIAKAYRGESLSVFNRMIAGQNSHVLGDYLSSWQRISGYVLVALGLGGLAAVIGIQPRVRRVVWGYASYSAEDSSQNAEFAWQRILAIEILMGVIIAGSLINIITDMEHWPFSNYAMYSFEEKSWSLTKFRLYGVTQEEPLLEFPLIRFEFTQPFDNSRLNYAFASIAGSHHRTQDFREAVRDCFARYEEHRRTGRNSGPPLQAMRLYWVYWVLDPQARNVDRPSRKDLIVEITQAEIKER